MSARPAIYLDANAGLPPLQQLCERLPGILSQLYNPSSSHQSGRRAKALLRSARDRIHASLSQLLTDLSDHQWIWTSGGTEGLQGAIRASVLSGGAKVWFYSPVEHLGSLGWLAQIPQYPGCHAIPLPLDAVGRVDLTRFREIHSRACADKKLAPGSPFIASFLWANNETGVIQHQVPELLQLIRDLGGYALVDACQAWGKIRQSKISLNLADWVATSGHKLGAFSGTGVLAFSTRARKLLETCPVFSGTQQSGLRAGTENLIGAWSLGEAAQLDAWANGHGIQSIRDELESRILSQISGATIQGRTADRVSNTTNVSFEGIRSKSVPLTDLLDLEGFAVSAGSACSSGIRRPSHVLRALGHSDDLALATLRISLAPTSSAYEALELFLPALIQVVEVSRRNS